jgi:hypothetical protein
MMETSQDGIGHKMRSDSDSDSDSGMRFPLHKPTDTTGQSYELLF